MEGMTIWYAAACMRLIFEVLAILCFSNTLAGESRAKTGPLLLIGGVAGAIIVLYDYLLLYFVPVTALALCALSLKLLSSVKLWELMGNLICGAAAIFSLEILVRCMFLLFWKDNRWETTVCDLVISGLLLVCMIAILTLYGDKPAAQRRRQVLQARKKSILIVSISLIVPVVMLANVFLTESILFFGGYHMIPFLAALYFVMNLFLIRYFVDSSHKESQLQIMNEYGIYLNEMIEKLNKREHEHKNQLNAVISIAEMDGPGCREQIIQYVEGLFTQKEEHKNMESIVSDNSVMAAWIFKMSRNAGLRGIRLDCRMAKPFPIYRMPEQELMELLANLVNNALEAAEQMPEDKRYVSVCLEESCIEVANYVDEDFHKSILKKTKPGFSTKGYGRGYGMSNIRDIVKRYNCTMETYLEGDLLTIAIHTGEPLH